MADNTIPIRRPQVDVPNPLKPHSDVPQKVESKYPTELIPLPTKGFFYPEGHPLSTGEVEVKQMTAREEDILANQELIRKGKVLDKLLESLLVDKSIKVDEILVPDKNAIFIGIRRLAYGNEYPISVACPSCNEQNKVNIDLSTIENKPFDFSKVTKGVNSFDFKMPSGTEVTYKILCQIDENSIEKEIEQMKKTFKDGKELTTRLKYLITSVNGNTDKTVIRRFVDEQLTAKDSLALRRHIKENSPDIDMSFEFTCKECEYERRMDVPISATFLWPDLES